MVFEEFNVQLLAARYQCELPRQYPPAACDRFFVGGVNAVGGIYEIGLAVSNIARLITVKLRSPAYDELDNTGNAVEGKIHKK